MKALRKIIGVVLIFGIVFFGAVRAWAQTGRETEEISCANLLRSENAPRLVVVMRAASCWTNQGKSAEAARVLQNQLETMDQAGQEAGRNALEKKLQEALAQIAAFDVQAVSGTEIVVDGQVIGKHPETNPLFLEPGSHVIIARRGQMQGQTTVEAKAGTLTPLEIQLRPIAKPAPWKEVLPEFDAPIKPPKTESKSKWSAGRIVMSTLGGVVGLTGLGLGIGFSVTAQKIEDQRAGIVRNFPLGVQQCHVLPDLPDCGRLVNLVEQRDRAWSRGTAGFVIGGMGLATAVVTMVWPRKTEPSAKQSALQNLVITPVVHDLGMNVTVSGAF